MNRQRKIDLAKQFLEHAPSLSHELGNADIAGWRGEGEDSIDLCSKCSGRIIARGCNLKLLVSIPVWKPDAVDCVGCA